jgi:hypothetical protein
MTYFLKSGNNFNVSAKAALDIYEQLPAGTYTVKFDPMKDIFFLQQIENFEVKGKLYGDTRKTGARIMNTFHDRPNSTGVMLSGEKGSGKTLQAKWLSLIGIEQGIPTIVINEAWHGEGFNAFIQSIEQPTIIIFDEFEKVYDRDDQEKMLTLLDGVYPSKKLFIITCNDKYRVNEHMSNRPGRIYYRLDYAGLETDFIIEYCEDNLKNQTHIDSICRMATVFGSFNFDMLKAMVEEMNRYDESPSEVIKLLNAKPELEDSRTYNVRLLVDDKEVEKNVLHTTEWRGNPLRGVIGIHYNKDLLLGKAVEDEDESWETELFDSSDLHSVDAGTGQFKFVNPDGNVLSLTKVQERQMDWAAL